FKHALVQEAAYSSLLRSARQQLHGQIAEALEAHFAELMDSQPEFLAHHYTEAGLVEKSVFYWSKAARRSAASSASTIAKGEVLSGWSGPSPSVSATCSNPNGGGRSHATLIARASASRRSR